jgi:hypothetical protein
MALHRTVLTYAVTFSTTASALYINTSESNPDTAGSANEYVLIVLMILGLLSFAFTFPISIFLMKIPINVNN